MTTYLFYFYFQIKIQKIFFNKLFMTFVFKLEILLEIKILLVYCQNNDIVKKNESFYHALQVGVAVPIFCFGTIRELNLVYFVHQKKILQTFSTQSICLSNCDQLS